MTLLVPDLKQRRGMRLVTSSATLLAPGPKERQVVPLFLRQCWAELQIKGDTKFRVCGCVISPELVSLRQVWGCLQSGLYRRKTINLMQNHIQRICTYCLNCKIPSLRYASMKPIFHNVHEYVSQSNFR